MVIPVMFGIQLLAMSRLMIPAGFETPELGIVNSSKQRREMTSADVFSSVLPFSIVVVLRAWIVQAT